MAEAVNIHEAKTHFSRLLARVGQGEEITICRAGKPVAKLVPIEQPRRERVPGRMAGQIWIADDFDEISEEELALFEGSEDA
jgi:prevent-host-death family protein